MISDYLINVCKISQGAECCRYLLQSPDGFKCAKMDIEKVLTLQDVLDGNTEKRLPKDILDENVRKGQMTAQGDNCEGKDPIPED